ncbi:MAG: aldehyde dehydrogenase EutE [Acidobacteria bacterium]|jgi:acyl-CoA reductase-like NAD-dependent aldehyde dehydrogenase|nr:aldehyde dehydrogenase EutE [Acidobacteriota bacterium]
MEVTDSRIEAIVDRVVEQLTSGTIERPKPEISIRQNINIDSLQFEGNRGCFPGIDSAINAAEKAFIEFKSISLEQRKKIITAIREICLSHLSELARIAVDETGLGRCDDKLKKNRLAILKTPGTEDLEPEAFSGDDGLSIQEKAPYGVIGSITPCTNPSETIICNGIGMIAGGNTVVFNPHPSAKKISAYTIDLMNKAVISEGGPPNLFTTIYNPTVESAGNLMKHPKIRLLVVTGGPAVVSAAMKSGKRVIAAGPGNPPVVVDETADLDKAAKDIVTSASCDNNIICVVEKEIIVTKNAADELKKSLLNHGAIEIGAYQARRLEKILLDENKRPNKKWVGKDIQKILAEIGMETDPHKRLGIIETSPDHPFAKEELLMPVVPFIRAKDIDTAIDLAYQLEGGCFHTAVIHSKNIDHMHRMAVKMNTSIFVKNGMALAGLGLNGEGPTSFTIASPTGEGLTTARHFTRIRRCVLSGYFRIV